MLDRTRRTLTLVEMRTLLERMFHLKENFVSYELFQESFPNVETAQPKHRGVLVRRHDSSRRHRFLH